MFDLSELNEKQLEAVKTTEGYVRVIAGAGSGKTKLLVHRYSYLVKECGIDPHNILCVTFTNKAAREMKNRIKHLIGEGFDTNLICTYHSFCAKILREEYEKLSLPKDFQIFDTYQQKQILNDIYQKYELKFNNASFEQILRYISKIKNENNYVEKMVNSDDVQILSKISSMNDNIVEDYLKKEKLLSALDFNDLIHFTIYLLKINKEVREKWQNRLNYILVDEFQDSSKIEMKLINILSEVFKNLMIVGDPDQNIYEWRGSDVKLLVDFDKYYTPTNTIILDRNYRSTPQILNCANSLISKNKLRLEKNLYTLNQRKENVVHYHLKDEESENIIIVQEIKRLIKRYNYNYSDIAILYRSSFLSRTIEKGLLNNNIPYTIYGGVKFFQRMEVLDALSYLKLICYGDDVAFKRIINVPRRKMGKIKMNYLQALQEKENKLLYDILKEHINDEIFKKTDVTNFVNLIEEARKEQNRKTLSNLVLDIIVNSGYDKYLKELGDEERLDNITEFKRIVNEYERNSGEEYTLSEFLKEITILSNEEVESDSSQVQLMTIHASKGLEFKVVFLIGLIEGIFPSSKTIEERKLMGLEEERRLCYVAITRAREKLYLIDTEGISLNGITNLPSRFLNEIEEKNYDRIGSIPKYLINKANDYISSHTPFDDKKVKLIGEEINHHIFGKGKIINIDEKHGSYEIKFDNIALPRNISKDYFEFKKEIEKNIIEVNNSMAENNNEKGNEFIEDSIFLGTNKDAYGDYDEYLEILIPNVDDAKYDSVDVTTINGIKPKHENINYGNLWDDSSVPKSEWTCVEVIDLGGLVGICEMCGKTVIRYSHHMIHKDYHDLYVGCICAGKMSGDMEGAKKRETDFKNKEKRKSTFMRKKWKRSVRENEYKQIKDNLVVIIWSDRRRMYTYSTNGNFSGKWFLTVEQLKSEIFDMYYNA